MNIRKYIYLTASVLAFGLTACSLDEHKVASAPEAPKVPELAEGVIEGLLFVRFDARVSDILDKAGVTKSGPKMPMKRSGVLSVDEILDLVEGYQIERIFPIDTRTEAKAREEGLHLWYVVRFPEKYSVEKVAADLSQLGEVSRVEYNRTLKRASVNKAVPASVEQLSQMATKAGARFDDTYFGYQWSLVNDGSLNAPGLEQKKFIKGADVSVEKAWDLSTGDPSIIVAVLDEGVDVDHPDLKGSMWVNEGEIWRSHEDNDGNGYTGDIHGYNFVEDHGVIAVESLYDTGHGSHVAGVIAATNNNGFGMSSIAGGDYANGKSGVKIMSCQIFSGAYAGSVLEEVRAIKYAADNGAVVLQCSWGYISGAANPYEWTPQYSNDDEWLAYNVLEKKALDYFVHNAGSPDGVIEGGVVVFAGGNEAAAAASYPGAYGDYVAVAATAGDYTPAVYTNYGPGTTISAPGGDQDYYYEADYRYPAFTGEGQLGYGDVGCILSTIPMHLSKSGYGYMEGTSMACPHVSGVVALGLSYAAQLRKHFTADEIKDLLYASATPIDEFMSGRKLYKKYVIDLEESSPLMSFEKNLFKGQMGHGQVNAYNFLKLIEGSGIEMTFPNLFVSVGEEKAVNPAMYMDGASFEVNVADPSVATAVMHNGKLIVKGIKEGQTTATIKGSRTDNFVITVRNGAAGNGWL